MISFVVIIFLIACGSSEILAHEHPKNVILVIANGMSATSVTAARVQEAIRMQNSSHLLSFETFPHHGTLKTYDSKLKFGSGISGSLALLHGTHNLHSCNETKTLLSNAQLSKKSTGLVTTMELTDTIPATVYGLGNEFSARSCPKLIAEHNCSDASCLLIHGFSGKEMDVIIGKAPLQVLDPFLSVRIDEKPFVTEWLEKESNRTYVNSTEQFEELKFVQGRQVLGLFSENDLTKHHFGEEHSGDKFKNVVNKAIKMLSRNPNGFLLVVIVGLDDVIKTIGLVSELSSSIWGATKNTLLVITSDSAHSLNKCTVEKTGNLMPRRKRNVIDEKEVSTTNSYNFERPFITRNISSSLTTPENHSDDVINATSENHSDEISGRVVCKKDQGHNFLDVPVYASGPYPGKFPAVQDQASFGKKMMELMEVVHERHVQETAIPKENYNEFEISTFNDKLDSDMFRSDIKAAMAQIDEMAKEIFKGWA